MGGGLWDGGGCRVWGRGGGDVGAKQCWRRGTKRRSPVQMWRASIQQRCCCCFIAARGKKGTRRTQPQPPNGTRTPSGAQQSGARRNPAPKSLHESWGDAGRGAGGTEGRLGAARPRCDGCSPGCGGGRRREGGGVTAAPGAPAVPRRGVRKQSPTPGTHAKMVSSRRFLVRMVPGLCWASGWLANSGGQEETGLSRMACFRS